MSAFDNFNPDFNNQHAQLEKVKSFKNSVKNTLFLVGTVGVGKTHLAKEFSKLYNKKKIGDLMSVGYRDTCAFIPVRDFHFLLYEYMFPDMEYTGSLKIYFKDLFCMECVIIDDLGTEPIENKGYFRSGLQDFLDRFTGKLLITTNLNGEALQEKYGEKIFSRLCENMEWVDMVGKDYRRV